jgi:hypothetical protein
MKITVTKFFNQKSERRIPWNKTGSITKKEQWQQTCDAIYKMLEDPTVNAVQINFVKEVK